MNKRAELKATISSIMPDVIAITEVYPKVQVDVDKAELVIDGFDCFVTGPEGRGACIYAKKSLNAKLVEHLTNSDFKESIWCEIRLLGEDKLLFGCIYRSPSSTDTSSKDLIKLINKACDVKYSHLLIVGDFNFSEIDWDTWTSSAGDNHGSSALIDCLQDNYLHQLIDFDTRYRIGQRPSLLDLVITNDDSLIEEVKWSSPLGKSDHVNIFFTMDCFLPDNKRDDKERFLYNKGEYEKLKKELSDVDWKEEMSALDVNDSWIFFENRLKNAMENHIPKSKPTKCDKKQRKFKPLWMNRTATQKVKKKYNAWKRYTRTKDYDHYVEYTHARNEATKEVRKAKRCYERSIANESKNSPKAFWKYVRSKTKTKSGVKDLLKEDGSYAHTDGDKADILNSFFASVFTNEDLTDVPEPDVMYDGEKLLDVPFTEEEVLKQLQKLNPSKSPGPDGLHPKVLKEASHEIALPLAIIFRKSMDEGNVPDGWRIAEVTAIFKKGSPAEAGNYRPVSLTSIVCKIMESVIRNHVMTFMKEHNIMRDEQHGFRQGRSCVTQLLQIMEMWTKMLEEGADIDVIYLDFRKAFDSVPHQRLLKKAKAHGIDGKVLQWIQSFLLGRKQRVSLNGAKSAWADVTSGIPQGSVLGPILFIVYINDLPNVVSSLVMMFADDTKVFSPIYQEEDCQKLQEDLNHLCDWSTKWLLQFNVSKCGMIHYGKGDAGHTYTMRDGDSTRDLRVIEEEKDLGVLFDSSLTFSKHIGTIANKATKIVGVIRRSFDYMDEQMFKTLYKSMVRPHLEYANTIWSPFLKRDIEKLEKVQRRATKIVPALRDLPYSTRLLLLDLPTLAYRRLRGDLIQVFKIVHGIQDVERSSLFVMTTNVEGLRGHDLKLSKQRSQTRLRQNCFSQRVCSAWNKLPVSVVYSQTTNIFKNGIDEFLSRNIDKFSFVGCSQQEQMLWK